MAVITIDPKTAFLCIDLQNGILSIPTVHPVTDVVQNAAALAAAFRQRDLPVVLIHVAGRAPGRTEATYTPGRPPSNWADFAPGLQQQSRDHVVTKRTWGAFTGTGLDAHLNALGVTQVVLAGVATSMGVESTARQAHELGFNVTFSVDAMTDPSRETHENSILRIFPKLDETGTTQEIINLLERTKVNHALA